MAKKKSEPAKTETSPQNANNAVSVVANIEKLQYSLYKKELIHLLYAREEALNIYRPRRVMLTELHDDVAMDMLLAGLIKNRIVRISNKPFMLIDVATGKPDMVATMLLKKTWFNSFIKLVMESVFYGYSLIYFKDIRNGEVKQVDVVDRRYVVPELNWLMRSYSDEQPMANYSETPVSQFFIGAGNPTDLGLLTKAAIGVILKKHSWQNWDEFEEIFGIPIRTATTPGNDKKVLDEIESWLKKMGSAAYGVFPEGTTLDIKENKSTDAYGIFNEKRKAINEELLVLVLGQTMTVMNGSSRSQSETHQKTSDEILSDDLTMVANLINDELLPRLRSFGYALKDTHLFAWDTAEALPLIDQWEIDKGLLEKFDIEPKYFQEKYNVPVKAKVITEPTNQPPQPEQKKKSPAAKMSLSGLYKPACGHKHHLPLITLSADGSNDAFINELANIVYNDTSEFPYQTYSACAEKLLEGFNLNFEFTNSAEKSGFQAKVQSNIYPFAAAKSYEQLAQLRDKLTDAQGNKKSFAAFKQDARNIVGTFNEGYLASEYNFATQCGISAQNWQDAMESADLYPLLEYSTVGDSRVRAEHKRLDGITLPVTDGFWDRFYPPNGWHCRCDAIPKDGINPSNARESDIIATEAVPEKLFQNNVGKTGIVFKNEHPYFRRLSVAPKSATADKGELGGKISINELRAEENYNLPSLESATSGGNLPTPTPNFANTTEANKWLDSLINEDGKILLTDFNGLSIQLKKEQRKHIFDRNDGQHWETLKNITDVLKNPNEVYQQTNIDSGRVNFVYCKYYKNTAVFTITELSGNELKITTHYQWDGTEKSSRDARLGLLLKKPTKKK